MDHFKVTSNETGGAFCCQVQQLSNLSHSSTKSALQLADAEDSSPHLPNFMVTVTSLILLQKLNMLKRTKSFPHTLGTVKENKKGTAGMQG